MKKEEVYNIIDILLKEYPNTKGSLNFSNPFEILVAVCLSAQCTDERVNLVTPALFKKYGSPELMANADLKDIEDLIHSCGFYKNKAKNLKAASQKIIKDYNGEVPHTMEELIAIPGVGRKSANVIMLEAFGDAQGIAVDTHCKRLSNRIGLSKEIEPSKIEQDLLKKIPKTYWAKINHLFIDHGRKVCKAPKPLCENCVIKDKCEYYKKEKNKVKKKAK